MASAIFFTCYRVKFKFWYIYKYFSSFHLVNCSSTNFQIWLYVCKKIFVPCITFFFSFSDSSDKTKGRAYLLKKKVLPRWDSNRGNINGFCQYVLSSVDILLNWTCSIDISFWKKNRVSGVELSKIHKWLSLDSLEFLWLCFERVPSTRLLFLKKPCNSYVSAENILSYCVF